MEHRLNCVKHSICLIWTRIIHYQRKLGNQHSRPKLRTHASIITISMYWPRPTLQAILVCDITVGLLFMKHCYPTYHLINLTNMKLSPRHCHNRNQWSTSSPVMILKMKTFTISILDKFWATKIREYGIKIYYPNFVCNTLVAQSPAACLAIIIIALLGSNITFLYQFLSKVPINCVREQFKLKYIIAVAM